MEGMPIAEYLIAVNICLYLVDGDMIVQLAKKFENVWDKTYHNCLTDTLPKNFVFLSIINVPSRASEIFCLIKFFKEPRICREVSLPEVTSYSTFPGKNLPAA